MCKERIQKVIAAGGVYSRRAVERLIKERKVKVNGILVTAMGQKVDPKHDRIQVAGKAVVFKAETLAPVMILFNKPRQVVVTRSDEQGRKTVYDLLPRDLQHLKPVGRLDYNTQGALIMTNDGDMILKLTHPRYHLDKVYEVKTTERPDEKQLKRLRQGIVIDGERTMPARVTVVKTHEKSLIIKMVIQEGRYRQVRKMCDAVGISVKELRRVAIGPVFLGTLRSGCFRPIRPSELQILERHFSKG